MSSAAPLSPVQCLWRYYQAGVVNSVFGYCLYALFVSFGWNRYIAQICAHVIGVVFNYFTYSRYAFRDSRASKPRFILSYVVNYLLGLAGLAAASIFIRSPYLAGLASIAFVSLVNYFILKHFVFFKRPAA